MKLLFENQPRGTMKSARQLSDTSLLQSFELLDLCLGQPPMELMIWSKDEPGRTGIRDDGQNRGRVQSQHGLQVRAPGRPSGTLQVTKPLRNLAFNVRDVGLPVQRTVQNDAKNLELLTGLLLAIESLDVGKQLPMVVWNARQLTPWSLAVHDVVLVRAEDDT